MKYQRCSLALTSINQLFVVLEYIYIDVKIKACFYLKM